MLGSREGVRMIYEGNDEVGGGLLGEERGER